jgi:cbb3-type cytochrome oxidase maturation protein
LTVDILYLLIPLSALLVLAILVVFAWALQDGQFDDVDAQGAAFQDSTPPWLDAHQAR